MFTRNIFLGSVGFMFSLFGINVSGAIAQSSNSLTSQQRALIDSTGINIVVPDYIPRGFQVYDVRVKCPECRGRNSPRGPSYGIIYRKAANDACFSIDATTGGIGGRLGGEYTYSYPITTRLFGNASVIFTSNSFLDMRSQNLPSQQQKRSPQPYLGTEWARNISISSSFYRLLGADFVRQSYYGHRRNQPKTICRNDITPLEAEKIVKSLKFLDTISDISKTSITVNRANVTDRYPTDAEMQILSQEFQQRVIPAMQRTRQYGKGRRDSALERFTQEWAKFDRSASFFLGIWRKGVDDIYIYPSSTQGQVCVIWILPAGRVDGRANVDALFSLGLTSNGQLKVNNMFFDRRRTVILRSGNYLATTSNRDNALRISPYSSISEPLSTIESLPLANKAENRKVVQQFYNAGCTASLPSVR